MGLELNRKPVGSFAWQQTDPTYAPKGDFMVIETIPYGFPVECIFCPEYACEALVEYEGERPIEVIGAFCPEHLEVEHDAR